METMDRTLDERFEQMIWDCHQGLSAEEAIRRSLGEEIARRSREMEPMIDDLSEQVSLLKAKYDGMDRKAMVFEEIYRRCGEDWAAQFRMVSDLKYMVSLKNLEMGRETIKAGGQDPGFLCQALEEAHKVEQQMAEEATKEELEALKKELSAVLPDNQEEIRAAMAQAARDEGWDLLFGQMEEGAGGVTEQAKRDVALLAGALYLSQHPGESNETAAVAGMLQAGCAGDLWDFVVLSLIVVMYAGLVGGVLCLMLSTLISAAILDSASVVLLNIGLAAFGGIILLGCGEVAFELAKLAAPHIRDAWQKCCPFFEGLAAKAGYGVSCAIGAVADHFARPVIYWISNTALPAIDEHIPCPLRRRLEGMLAWLGEKKEQVLEFIRQSAAYRPQDLCMEPVLDVQAGEEEEISVEM